MNAWKSKDKKLWIESKFYLRNPPGIHYVNETMKMVKDTMRVKKQLTQENNFLRDKYKTFSLSKSQSGWARGKGNKILKRVL